MIDNPYAPPGARVADVAVDVGQELASRLARLGGSLIDSLFAIVTIVPVMYFTGYFAEAFSAAGVSLGTQLAMVLVSLVLFMAVNGYLLATSGQTVGKRVAGTQIVSVADGQILPLGKLIGLRSLPISLISLIPVIGSIIPLIDVLLIFRADRRCGHDLIAGTKVVRADAVPNLDLRSAAGQG